MNREKRLENIKVNIRIKPINKLEASKNKGIAWKLNKTENAIELSKEFCSKYNKPPFSRNFDSFFEGSDNSIVYNEAVQSIVKQALKGYNGTVFAYGQTSSGKTYTMTGTEEEPGIIPQSIDELFKQIRLENSQEYLIRVTYFEIYNEQIKDLLNPQEGKELKILDDQVRGVFIPNLSEEIVTTPKHVMKLFEKGELNRHFSKTEYNLNSSRSHSIFQIIIESKRIESKDYKIGRGFDGTVKFSQLNLIDLAGSESTSEAGERRKESAYINKSLLTLGTVISKLLEGRGHVPFRDSKLTRILQHSLTGKSLVSVICTVNLYGSQCDETINTLKFGTRIKRIEVRAVKTKLIEDKTLIQQYKKEIKSLHTQLENNDLKDLKEEKERYRDEVDQLQNSQVLLKERIHHLERLILTPSNTSDKVYKRSRPLSIAIAGPINFGAGPIDKREDNNEQVNKLMGDIKYKNRYIEEIEKIIEKILNNPRELDPSKDAYFNVKELKSAWDRNSAASQPMESKVNNTLSRVKSFKSNRKSLIFNKNFSVDLASNFMMEKLQLPIPLNNHSDVNTTYKEKVGMDNEELNNLREEIKEMELLMEEQNQIIIELEQDRQIQTEEILKLKNRINQLEIVQVQSPRAFEASDDKISALKSSLDSERKLRFQQQLRHFEQVTELQQMISKLSKD